MAAKSQWYFKDILKIIADEYINVINKIRSMFDDVSITTDFLAGFVGETEEEFNQAIEFIKQIKYADMHIFPYSRRKGTEADQMTGHLHPTLQKERAHILLSIAEELKHDYESKFIGRTVEVLVENMKKDYWRGYTSNYLDIYFKSNDNLENKLVKIQITEIKNNIIYGIRKDD